MGRSRTDASALFWRRKRPCEVGGQKNKNNVIGVYNGINQFFDGQRQQKKPEKVEQDRR